MNLRAGFLYAGKIFFSKDSGSSNGKRSLFGALISIGLCLVPLIAVLVVSEGMISGITGRIVHLSTQDMCVSVDKKSDFASTTEAFLQFADGLSGVEGVTGAYPQISGTALAAGSGYRTGANVRAVPRTIFTENTGFASLFNVIEGSADLNGKKSAVIGQKIAELLGIHEGYTIKLITVKSTGTTKKTFVPKVAQYTVRGIVSCGYQELDALWVFIPLDEGFSVMAGTDAEYSVGLTTDVTFSPKLRTVEYYVQKHIISLGNGTSISGAWVSTWDEMNSAQFENFSSTKILLLLIMLLIVLVASVNISSALVMTVMERRREIAILKSTGATANGITMAFLITGLGCGAGGVLIGVPLGLLVSVNINAIISGMEKVVNAFRKFGWILLNHGSDNFEDFKLLDPGYYLQEIPVTIPFKELFLIVTGTLLLSLIVSAVPAIRAGREKPLDTLRKL